MSRAESHVGNIVPSEDWQLNVLLLKVSQALSEDDLTKFKFLCTGHNGIPCGVLERLTSHEKLFAYLRQQRMISRDNLLLLQAFLWHVARPDLHAVAADFARRRGDTLYFYAPQTHPEEGFQHVRFHVAGGLGRFRRRELETLRSQVSTLLFVPPEFVFLSGVEPDHPVTLTFMVHRNCQTPLPDLLQGHSDHFSSLGIDRMWVQGTELPLSGPTPLVMESELEKEVSDLLHSNFKLQVRVSSQDETLAKHAEELHCARQEATGWRRRESYFRTLLARASEQPNGFSDGNNGTDSPVTLHGPVAVEDLDGSVHFIV